MVKKFSDLKIGDKVYWVRYDYAKNDVILEEGKTGLYETRMLVWIDGKHTIEVTKYVGYKAKGWHSDKVEVFRPKNKSLSFESFNCISTVFTEREAAEKFLKKIKEKNSCLWSLENGTTVYIYHPKNDTIIPYTINIRRTSASEYNIDELLSANVVDVLGKSNKIEFDDAKSIFSFDRTDMNFYDHKLRTWGKTPIMFFSKEVADKWWTERKKKQHDRIVDDYVALQTKKKLEKTDFLGNELFHGDNVIFIVGCSKHYYASHSELRTGIVVGETKNGITVEYVGDDKEKIKKNVASYGIYKHNKKD